MKTEADLERLITGVVSQVIGGLVRPPSPGTASQAGGSSAPTVSASWPAPRVAQARGPAPAPQPALGPEVLRVQATGRNGLFGSVDDAVAAARAAQRKLAAAGVAARRRYVEAIRAAGVALAEPLARSAYEETKLGRYTDKVAKNVFAATRTLGVEDLEPRAFTGDHGTAIDDQTPWGVVASITPINSPSAFIINHAITMLAGGNAVVFNTHPGCWNTSLATMELLNKAVVEAGGPDNLMTSVLSPTLDSAKALVQHAGVDMLVITGGAALIRDAFATRKRVIAAGPGNPTAVVDETADVRRAAREVFQGCTFDNTILCIGEKTCIVADRAYGGFLHAMEELPVRRLDAREVDRVFDTIIDSSDRSHPTTRREFVGKDAEVLLQAAGLSAGKPVGMLLAEVDRDHPLVRMEQFVPFLPLVRARDGDDAADLGVEVEGGNRHTVMIHSNDPDRVARFAREANTVIVVVNGSSLRGLGVDGEGYPGFTIGTVTGEGLTSARHFVKARRLSHTR